MFPDGRVYVEGLFILYSSEVLGAKPPSLHNENLDRSEKLKVVLCNLVTRKSPQCESVLRGATALKVRKRRIPIKAKIKEGVMLYRDIVLS